MPVRAELEAVEASALADDEKRAARYRIKTAALLDVIRNGAGPAVSLLGQVWTSGGARYRLLEAMAGPHDQLIFGIEVNGAKHTVYIINPPFIPRQPTGDERIDMMQAVREMLEGIGV